jgi:hypothetical protein
MENSNNNNTRNGKLSELSKKKYRHLHGYNKIAKKKNL